MCLFWPKSIEVTLLAGSYEMVEHLWSQFFPSDSNINIGWPGRMMKRWLVSVLVPEKSICVNDRSFQFSSELLHGLIARTSSCVAGWVMMSSQLSLDFEDWSEDILVYISTWDWDTFGEYVMCCTATKGMSVLGSLGAFWMLCGDHLSVVALPGGSYVLRKRIWSFWGVDTIRKSWSILRLI